MHGSGDEFPESGMVEACSPELPRTPWDYANEDPLVIAEPGTLALLRRKGLASMIAATRSLGSWWLSDESRAAKRASRQPAYETTGNRDA